MNDILGVLLTFIGVMLLLALAAQSLQELIKSGFAIKSMAARAALDGLIVEAAKVAGQTEGEGREIASAVVKRLRGLGQAGWRDGAIRLDKIDAAGIASLVAAVSKKDIEGLRNLPDDIVHEKLVAIGAKAAEWFRLSSDPVDERYRRRMRFLSLACAGLVVVLLNADALYVFRAAQNPAYRAAAAPLIQHQDSLLRLYRAASADTTRRARADSLWHQIDSVSALVMQPDTARAGFLVGDPGTRRLTDPLWLLGIVISTLLVSMGAPFWHDALESLMGFKNRVRAQADVATAAASGNVAIVPGGAGLPGALVVRPPPAPAPPPPVPPAAGAAAHPI